MDELKLIEAAQVDMAGLKDKLAKIAKINKDAGRDEINLVTSELLADLQSLHARMGLALLKYYPAVSVRGPGR
jgi:hypothetical protein